MNKTFLLRPHIKHLGGVIRFVQNQPWIRIQVNFIVDPRTSVADPDPVIQDQIRELDRIRKTANSFLIKEYQGSIRISIWSHSVEQVYLGYNHNKSTLYSADALRALEAEGEKGGKGNLLFTSAQHPFTICLIS